MRHQAAGLVDSVKKRLTECISRPSDSPRHRIDFCRGHRNCSDFPCFAGCTSVSSRSPIAQPLHLVGCHIHWVRRLAVVWTGEPFSHRTRTKRSLSLLYGRPFAIRPREGRVTLLSSFRSCVMRTSGSQIEANDRDSNTPKRASAERSVAAKRQTRKSIPTCPTYRLGHDSFTST